MTGAEVPRRTTALTIVGVALVVAGLVAFAITIVASRGGNDEPVAGKPVAVDVTVTRSEPVPSTAPVAAGGLVVGWAPEARGRQVLRGFGQVRATITAANGKVCQVCLLAASDGPQRQRGLMEVTDPTLGGHDGMVFVYDEAIEGAFWMRNTPMPLSIAYFDADGTYVSRADMAPCGDRSDCPSYPATRSFRYAFEVPAGRLDQFDVGPGAVLEIVGGPCPLAAGS